MDSLLCNSLNKLNRTSLSGEENRSTQLTLQLLSPGQTDRSHVEHFIQQRYQTAYNARLEYFYPYLLVMRDECGEIKAVAGIRPARHLRLFSEHYIDDHAENLLETTRDKIVEVGNLVSSDHGIARELVANCTAFLCGAGFAHVIFTLTPVLANTFKRMGLPLTFLAHARKSRIPIIKEHDWGNYYDQSPKVFSGNIQLGFQTLFTRYIGNKNLNQYWEKALKYGAMNRYCLEKINFQ